MPTKETKSKPVTLTKLRKGARENKKSGRKYRNNE